MHVLNPNTRLVPEPNNPFPEFGEPDTGPIAPPEPVALRILLGGGSPKVNVVGSGTGDAEGTLPFPEGIIWILLAVVLNLVGAIEISELS